MSGGHFEYGSEHYEALLHDMALDPHVMMRWTRVACALDALSEALGNVIRDMDFALEGDMEIDNDAAWQDAALRELRNALHPADVVICPPEGREGK